MIHQFQHQIQHQRKEQQQHAHHEITPEKIAPLNDLPSLYCQPHLVTHLSSSQFSTPAKDTFGSPYFNDFFYCSRRLLLTAKSSGISMGHTYLEPTFYFLLIRENKCLHVFAISDVEAAFFQERLLSEELPSKSFERQVALLTADGALAQNGKGSYVFTQKLLKRIEELPWFQEVVSDIGFLACRIRDLKTFTAKAEKCSETERLLHQIATWQPDRPNTSLLENVIRKTRETNKKGFFSLLSLTFSARLAIRPHAYQL